jgi:hypothetical protein
MSWVFVAFEARILYSCLPAGRLSKYFSIFCGNLLIEFF